MSDNLEVRTASGQTPGKILKDAREAKKIGQNEIAQRLLLSTQVIAALEEDDYSRIPAQVYAEGYLRAYANFLQIPVDTIITAFRRLDIYEPLMPQVVGKSEAGDGKEKMCAGIGKCSCQKYLTMLKNRNAKFVVLGFCTFLILCLLALFVGKQVAMSTSAKEVANVAPAADTTATISDNPIPVITTNNQDEKAEVAIVPQKDNDKNKKKKNDAKKTGDIAAQDVPLMLDSGSVSAVDAKQADDENEPKIVLTTPKKKR